MSSIIQEEPVDVCVLGLGVAGGTISAELSLTGYKVAGIEKGPYWDYATDFAPTKYDEWGVAFLRKFDHPARISTFTLRNNSGQMAQPVRRNTAVQTIVMGHGVGGMAQHYAGQMGRYGPWSFEMKSATASKYGSSFLSSVAPMNDIEDWPMTYQDYDSYWVEFEKAFGLTGTNQGPLVPMSKNYPLPPHPLTQVAMMHQSAAESMGYHPYPKATSLASQPYMNQYGVQVNECVYDGYCSTTACAYQCETGAKANSAYRTIPAAISSGNFKISVNSYVFRLDTDPTTNMVTAARYYDTAGKVHVQPATVFFNGLWGHNIPRLMALSDIGTQYNPTTVKGSLGRGVTFGTGTGPGTASVSGTFNIGGNAYGVGNAAGGAIDTYDFADDNFDHTGLNFVGGSVISMGQYLGGPANYNQISGAATAASMGSKFKASLKDRYLPTTTTVTVSPSAPELADTRWAIDLDPHYNDIYGDPLARVMYDWTANAYNGAVYLVNEVQLILQKMGASNITINKGVTVGTTYHADSWVAHTRGGCRIGSNPDTSVFNKFQQSWVNQNLFAAGEITNTTGNNVTPGTHMMGAECYVAADGIRAYLKSPVPLV